MCRSVDAERVEIAGVDPDHVCAEGEGPLELGRRVRLDERVEPQRLGSCHEPCGLPVVEIAKEEQDRVGSRFPELAELRLVAEEALGEDR